MISIMSHDGIGIVYAVSHAISRMGGDIADLRQSVLRGYFTMILLASFGPGATAQTIKRLAQVRVPGIPPLEVYSENGTQIPQIARIRKRPEKSVFICVNLCTISSAVVDVVYEQLCGGFLRLR